MTEVPAKSAPRLFLVDAYALIYRSFFAFVNRPLMNSKGENTSAAWGFVNFLLRIRDKHAPDYMAVVFDSGMSHREKEYPEYKATREKMPDELRASLPRIRSLLAAFHDEVVELEGYEADDVIGTLAARAREAGVEAVIVSGDKDFHQLVGQGVHLLNPGRGGPGGVAEEWVDESNAAERLGVPAAQVVDFLALVGDSSDNVPGAPGVGEGWARRLLAEIGPLDDLLAHPERIPWEGKRKSIAENVDRIRLARRLVTIRTDLPVPLDLEKLRVRPPDLERLREICAELEFKTLIDRFAREGATSPKPSGDAGVPGAPPVASPAAPPGTPHLHRVVTDPAELPTLVAAARASGAVAVRVLTGDPGTRRPRPIGIALAWGAESRAYLPLAHGGGPASLLDGDLGSLLDPSPLDPKAAPPANLPSLDDARMRPLVDLLQDAEVPKVGADLKAALLALRARGVAMEGTAFDTTIASYVLDPGRRDHSLRELAIEILGGTPMPLDEVIGKGRAQVALADAPLEAVAAWSCEEAELALRLRDRFLPALEEHSLAGLFREVEMPLVPVLAEMEWHGVRIDSLFFAETSRRLEKDLDRIREDVYKEAGGEFNINSNPQLREILFEKLGLPVVRRTKTGPSTDASVLEELAERGYALPIRLMEYRQLEKLRSTYVDALPRLVNSETGRIHASFNQAVAATGRLSSSDPNLQNIPIRTDVGREIRKGFVADPEHLLLAADYSQIELRILAHFSGDAAFVEAFRKGIDVHRQTAAVIFGVEVGEVTDDQRARAKTINFATLYGQGEFSLARQLGITREEAGRFIAQYFERFAGVRAFLDEQIRLAKERGYVETLAGRRRYIAELDSKNWNIRQFGERIAQNTPIQGTAADLIKIAMIRIHRGLAGRARMLVQVHDELIFEVPEGRVEEVTRFVVEEMEGAMKLAVPLEVEVGVGRSWYECSG